MGFPNKKDINEILKMLDKAEGTYLLSDDPTPLEKLRWDLCQKFVSYKQEQKITQKEISLRLNVDESKVSKILHHRIKEFSTDRLINLFSKLDNNLHLKVG